jgi:carbamoyltransferase
MSTSKISIGIYGIQDINNDDYPGYVHDHGIAIMQDGNIKEQLHLERITRNKYDNKLHHYLYQLLKSKKLLNKNFDIAFVDNVISRSFISKEGNIRFEAPITEKLNDKIEKGRLFWLDKHKSAYVLNHELAHLYSCVPFFGNFKKESLLIHFDGGASLSNFSAWSFKNNNLELIDYHWKLKQISSFFNANALTFGIIGATIKEQNSVPGKLMGLASFGQYDSKIEKWLIENSYFESIWKSKKTFINQIKSQFNYKHNFIQQSDPSIQNIVATFHEIFIRETLNEIKYLKEKTKAKHLYFTGGSALNIKLNTRIIEKLGFENVFIPPCTNDSGLAIGAACYMEIMKGNSIKMHSPYLNNWGINYDANYTLQTIKDTAALLIKKKIIGISNNSGEIGPRALGNRSIISLANSNKLSKKVSIDIKKREWYRPVAPIMLEKNAKHFTGKKEIHQLSKYMLLDFNINKDKITDIEGVVHADGTARIQTLFTKEDNPFMWDLLTFLDNGYDIKALINTSFNSQGEPIVHTEEDSIRSAKRMKLDAVVLNGELKILDI